MPRTGAPAVPSQAVWALISDGDLDERSAAELFFIDASDIRNAWVGWGDQILREWVRQHPGTRPGAWWYLDAPRSPVARSSVISIMTWIDIRATESEASYLLRHDLFLPGERRRLGEASFAPIRSGGRQGGLRMADERGKWFCVLDR